MGPDDGWHPAKQACKWSNEYISLLSTPGKGQGLESQSIVCRSRNEGWSMAATALATLEAEYCCPHTRDRALDKELHSSMWSSDSWQVKPSR